MNIKNNKYGLQLFSMCGSDGPCLYVGQSGGDGGYTRISGPKPWGSNQIIHKWNIYDEEDLVLLRTEINMALRKIRKK